MKDIYMVIKSTKCILYYDQSDPRVAQRVRSNRQDEQNITEAAPNELKLGEGA